MTEQEKRLRVEGIVNEILAECGTGPEVAFEEIQNEHPELMPELGEQLHTLASIEDAAKRARQLSRSDESRNAHRFASAVHLRFLRDALPGYEILECLHFGGQGVVYRAIQTATKRTVAIKVLLNGPIATPHQCQRFEREIELISRLRHPNIVTLYDSGVVRDRHFFAMEYVDGLPIDDHAILHDLLVRDRVRLFREVCLAVSSAHQQGIIHRDLKPSNILVDTDGDPHIVDFGLAKTLLTDDDDRSLSLTGQIVGTLPYLSPEQAAGRAEHVDVRSDIYSLGVVLYQLLTDQYPYPVAGDRQTVLQNICTREPIAVRRALSLDASIATISARDIDDDLEKVVLKALEKDPARRYQSAAALADDLQRFLTGDVVEAKAASPFYLLRRTARRFRVHIAVSVAFVLLLIAAVIGMTVLWQRAERVARIAQAGLQMGSYLKLGSVQRDDGRLDQATAMFEKALEIGRGVTTSDPVVQSYRYAALHGLAELYFDDGRPDEAQPHCTSAIELARNLIQADPENMEWRRQLGFSQILQGRMAYSVKEYERALISFEQAAALRAALHALQPENESLALDLAIVLGWQGKCCRQQKRYDESHDHYRQAHEIYQQLHESAPNVVEYAIELSRAETMLAVWHLSQRSADNDQAALGWLQLAAARLTTLRDSGDARGRAWDLTLLLDNVEANARLANKRITAKNNPS